MEDSIIAGLRARTSLMSTAEIARLLNVDNETVTKWVKEGKLTAIAINSKLFRYSPAEIVRWLIASQVTGCEASNGQA
jgi:excisionase family DNA binding protein